MDETDEVIDSGILRKRVQPHPDLLSGVSVLAFVERFVLFSAFNLLIYELFANRSANAEGWEVYDFYLLYLLGTLVLQIPGGIVVDRYTGPVKGILWGGFFLATGIFFLPFGGDLLEIPGVVLMWIGSALFGPALPAWLGYHYASRTEFSASGFSFFLASGRAGSFLGSVVVAYALNYIGWKEGLMISGILLLAALIFFFAVKKNLAQPGVISTEPDFKAMKSIFFLIPPMVGAGLFIIHRSGIKASQVLEQEAGDGIRTIVGHGMALLIIAFLYVKAQKGRHSTEARLRTMGSNAIIIAAMSAIAVGLTDYIQSKVITIGLISLSVVVMAWSIASLLPGAYSLLFEQAKKHSGLISGVLNVFGLAPYGLLILSDTDLGQMLEIPLSVAAILVLTSGGFHLMKSGRVSSS